MNKKLHDAIEELHLECDGWAAETSLRVVLDELARVTAERDELLAQAGHSPGPETFE